MMALCFFAGFTFGLALMYIYKEIEKCNKMIKDKK